MVYTLRFSSSKCSLFHNSNVFGSRIIHILCIGCAKWGSYRTANLESCILYIYSTNISIE